MGKVKSKDRIIGLFYVLIVPLILVISAVAYWIISQPFLILVLGLFGLLYAAYLGTHIDYGPNFIRRVKIPNAPTEIEALLKTTTLAGDLICAGLISAFDDEEKMSKTNMANWVQKNRDVQLTYQAILPYINDLEQNNLIHSTKLIGRDYEFVLTDKGQWCREALKVCFPQTLFWYALRHFLGRRKLKDYPISESHQKT